MEGYDPRIDGHTNPANLTSLVSHALEDSFGETSRALRHDGWTPERERIFCERLAQTGVVVDAARAVGMSAQSAYAHRSRARGRAFHLGWEAALIHARRRLSDELLSRALNGCIEQVHQGGAIVSERHRYDNRLSMAVLTRLDRQTEDSRQEATAARIVADEFEQFMDLVEAGGEGVRDFMAVRRPADERRQPSREEQLLARLENYRRYRVGLADEIDVSDLDPACMASWTEEQVEHADLSGFLNRLRPEQWPQAIRDAAAAEAHGMSQLHQLYLRRHPAPVEPKQDEFGGMDVWKDDYGDCWTDFPPPADFDGEEEGEWGEEDYRRSLSEAEQAVIDADLEEERAEERAVAHAARVRFFGLQPDAGQVSTSSTSPASFAAEAAGSEAAGNERAEGEAAG